MDGIVLEEETQMYNCGKNFELLAFSFLVHE